MENEIQKTFINARNERLNRIKRTFIEVQQNDSFSKSEDNANPFDELAEEIEKSDVLYALNEGNIKISKTGEEIKKQIDEILMPDYISFLNVKKSEADKELENCGKAPTNDPYGHWTNDLNIDCGYKVYDWDQTYFNSKGETNLSQTLSAEDQKTKEGANLPESFEQGEARRRYNDLVRMICDIMVDIKVLEILKTLKPKTDYEFTPKQILVFRF